MAVTDDQFGGHTLDEPAELRRFAGNTGWVLAAQVVGKLAALVLFVMVARALDRSGFGYFVFAIAFTPLFFVFASTGMNPAVVREIARDHTRFGELFSSGLYLRAGMGVVALAAAAAIALAFVHSAEGYLAVLIVGGARFFDDLSGQHLSAFRAFERMRSYALIDISNRTLSMILTAAALLVLPASVTLVCTTYLLGSAGALVIAHVMLRRELPHVSIRKSSNRRATRELFSIGTPLGMGGVLNTGAFRIDTVMLQAIRGVKEVALYGTAYAVFEALVGFSWSLSSITLPAMSRARTALEASRIFELTVGLVLVIFLPAAVTVPFAAHSIIGTVFSDRYVVASSALSVLVAAGLLYAIAHVSRVACIALGRRKAIAVIALLTLTANVAMNSVAIPLYGFRGAAWTTLATEVFEAAILIGLLTKTGAAVRFRKIAAVPVTASGVVAVVLVASGVRGWVAVAVATAVYPAMLGVAGRFLAPEQVRLLRTALFPRPLPLDSAPK